MKIYFAASIRGGREDQAIYFEIINDLTQYGEVLTEHVGSHTVTEQGELLDDVYIYERDMMFVNQSDVIVAEISTTSLGVGYEIGWADAKGKRIICLYKKKEGKRLSAMLAGNKNLTFFEYVSFEEVKDFLKKQFKN